MHRLLDHALADFEAAYLPLDLGLQSPMQEAERVHVLELGLGAERLAGMAHRHVGVAAEGALLHVDVGDPELLDEAAQLGQERPGLIGRGDVGLGDDLDQRRAAPVEVHQRVVGSGDAARGPARVDELARVLFQVHPGDAHPQEAPVLQLHVQMPADAQGQVVLRDLVGLGQVRIEVVLAVEDGPAGDAAVESEGDAGGVLDGLLVGDRKHARDAPGRSGTRGCSAARRR